jgi:tetratricopeptide (TPR) repeat protein
VPKKETILFVEAIAESCSREYLAEVGFALKSHLRIPQRLDIEFLNRSFADFRDAFDEKETERLIRIANASADHATRLAMQWAAMRQLSAVPYTRESAAETMALWERSLEIWITSAAWYGLHNDSPIGLLSAVNSLILVRSHVVNGLSKKTTPQFIHGTRGARASALYSMARRSWRPRIRWSLLSCALKEVDAAIESRPSHLAGYLAIRGSIHLLRGEIAKAISEHEQVVSLRKADKADGRAIGEALTELGWTYAWGLRFRSGIKNLSEGVELMRSEPLEGPNAAGFLVRALRKLAMVQLVTLDFSGARRTAAEARELARRYLVRDQGRRILWL